jgi:hypothetical protein
LNVWSVILVISLSVCVPPFPRVALKMLQLALLNRVPFGKFNRASAFPVATRLEDLE